MMNAIELKQEVRLRLEVEKWIEDKLLPKFVSSNGEPVSYSVGADGCADVGSLTFNGQKYLEYLGFILKRITIPAGGSYGNHYSAQENYVEISLPK